MYYLDTSAAVKLVIPEAESEPLRAWLGIRDGQIFSSELLLTELLRVTRRRAPGRMTMARAILDSLILVRLSTDVCGRAAILEPVGLRSLDALHLSAALELGDELSGIVTYDWRLAEAARLHRLEVKAPT